jgi:hypothetical protein
MFDGDATDFLDRPADDQERGFVGRRGVERCFCRLKDFRRIATPI